MVHMSEQEKSCPFIHTCGFVKKYEGSKAPWFNGYVLLFCMGKRQSECVRKKYRQNGYAPDDSLMPNGSTKLE
jgi:hypothetical protein